MKIVERPNEEDNRANKEAAPPFHNSLVFQLVSTCCMHSAVHDIGPTTCAVDGFGYQNYRCYHCKARWVPPVHPALYHANDMPRQRNL